MTLIVLSCGKVSIHEGRPSNPPATLRLDQYCWVSFQDLVLRESEYVRHCCTQIYREAMLANVLKTFILLTRYKQA